MKRRDATSDEQKTKKRWSDRHGWLGALLMAMFAGLAPAPGPKPVRVLSEHHQVADEKDGEPPSFDFLAKEERPD